MLSAVRTVNDAFETMVHSARLPIMSNIPFQHIAALKLLIVMCCAWCGGCSTLGLTLWPSQLPILSTAKKYAAQSPMPGGLNHEFSKQTVPDYFVEPGDRLLIEPIELDSKFHAVGDQEVKVDGSVDLGRFGRIRVAGMTVEAIEVAVADQIAVIAGEREAVNVQLIEANASQVYVLGAVGSPGTYALDGHETVLDAILKAGGLTSKASPCDIMMVRPTNPCDRRVVQRICFRQITQLGDVSTNYQLQPGDRIVVGERTLFEELAFWKQARSCPCCDRQRGVQCHPTTENYANRFVHWLAPFPNPISNRTEDATENDESMSVPNADPPRGTGSSDAPKPPQRQTPQETPDDDKDFFLPAEPPSATDSSRLNRTHTPTSKLAGV